MSFVPNFSEHCQVHVECGSLSVDPHKGPEARILVHEVY